MQRIDQKPREQREKEREGVEEIKKEDLSYREERMRKKSEEERGKRSDVPLFCSSLAFAGRIERTLLWLQRQSSDNEAVKGILMLQRRRRERWKTKQSDRFHLSLSLSFSLPPSLLRGAHCAFDDIIIRQRAPPKLRVEGEGSDLRSVSLWSNRFPLVGSIVWRPQHTHSFFFGEREYPSFLWQKERGTEERSGEVDRWGTGVRERRHTEHTHTLARTDSLSPSCATFRRCAMMRGGSIGCGRQLAREWRRRASL